MNKFKWFSILILAVALTLTITGNTHPIANAATVSLSDIKGHWAESAIESAITAGYVSGYQDGTFKPNAMITKAEFLKMLVGALDFEVTANTSPWYQGSIDTAISEGIYANDFASTDWNMTLPRKEMALLAVRAGITGYKADYDVKRNMYEATLSGIIGGIAPGDIAPDGTTTRAQAITVIERVLQVKSGKTLPNDKYAISAAELYWHKTNIFTRMPELTDLESNYVNPAAKRGRKSWEEPDLTLSAYEGKYLGKVDGLIAIDLADANDPNIKLLKGTGKYPIKVHTESAMVDFKQTDWTKYYAIVLQSSILSRGGATFLNNLYIAAYGVDYYNFKESRPPSPVATTEPLLSAILLPKDASKYKDDLWQIGVYMEASPAYVHHVVFEGKSK